MPSYAVGLADVVDAVRVTVIAGSRSGNSQARIELSPAELGGVRIQLTQNGDGLSVRVLADHPAAAQALAQSAGELRSALAAMGVSVTRLDIGTSAQQGSAAGNPQDGANGSSNGRSTGDADPESTADAVSLDDLTVQPPSGGRIDVLA